MFIRLAGADWVAFIHAQNHGNVERNSDCDVDNLILGILRKYRRSGRSLSIPGRAKGPKPVFELRNWGWNASGKIPESITKSRVIN